MPRITDFCSCVYVLGCKLSLVRLCDSDFVIIPVDDITIRMNCAAFCFHIAHISFASSWYLFCLSVIVLARLCVFGTAMSIKMVFFVFLFIKVLSCRLKLFIIINIIIIIEVTLPTENYLQHIRMIFLVEEIQKTAHLLRQEQLL